MKDSVFKPIPLNLLSSISGGLGLTTMVASTGVALFMAMEFMHTLMGSIEFINYTANFFVNGCSEVDEKDFVGQSWCSLCNLANDSQ